RLKGTVEDRIFFAKLLAEYPVYLSGREWALYRQHDRSHSASASEAAIMRARLKFLSAFNQYVMTRPHLSAKVRQQIAAEKRKARRELAVLLARSMGGRLRGLTG
ncbi:hypothetical protein WDZ92_22145, partial [Nostoc sp. NIES-2111]